MWQTWPPVGLPLDSLRSCRPTHWLSELLIMCVIFLDHLATSILVLAQCLDPQRRRSSRNICCFFSGRSRSRRTQAEQVWELHPLLMQMRQSKRRKRRRRASSIRSSRQLVLATFMATCFFSLSTPSMATFFTSSTTSLVPLSSNLSSRPPLQPSGQVPHCLLTGTKK